MFLDLRRKIGLTENRFLIDSSAWIEYFKGTNLGKKVKEILEDSNNQILTPKIVIAEVTSKIARSGQDPTEAFLAIESFSIQINEKQEYFFEAGVEHAKLKQKFEEISLADALIKVLEEKNNAKIVTKDFHLKGKNTIFIG